jgi:hypothetical protein
MSVTFVAQRYRDGAWRPGTTRTIAITLDGKAYASLRNTIKESYRSASSSRAMPTTSHPNRLWLTSGSLHRRVVDPVRLCRTLRSSCGERSSKSLAPLSLGRARHERAQNGSEADRIANQDAWLVSGAERQAGRAGRVTSARSNLSLRSQPQGKVMT